METEVEVQEQSTQQTHIPLHLGLLKDINLDLYPKERTHYLAYALQNGLEPPSVVSMNRSEARNQRKSGADKANQATGRIVNVIKRTIKGRKRFILPERFGVPKAMIGYQPRKLKRGKKALRGKGKAQRKYQASAIPVFRPGRAIPGKKPISLPVQISRKPAPQTKPKQQSTAFKTRSPQWISLRAERQKFREQIQKYREQHKKQNERMEVEKVIPEYFKKKKANQKRRRQQKHQLIKENRKALVEIFGNAVFNKGWPISRREIKLALGIKEEDHEKQLSVGEFMAMAEQSMVSEKKSHKK